MTIERFTRSKSQAAAAVPRSAARCRRREFTHERDNANQSGPVAHGFMIGVGHSDGRQFSGPMKKSAIRPPSLNG